MVQQRLASFQQSRRPVHRKKKRFQLSITPPGDSSNTTNRSHPFFSRAKKISNKPQINQVITKRALIEKYVNQIEALKADLAASQQKNGVYMDPSEYEKMKEDLEALNLEKEQRLVKDAQIDEAMQKLRDEIDEQIQKNEGRKFNPFSNN